MHTLAEGSLSLCKTWIIKRRCSELTDEELLLLHLNKLILRNVLPKRYGAAENDPVVLEIQYARLLLRRVTKYQAKLHLDRYR